MDDEELRRIISRVKKGTNQRCGPQSPWWGAVIMMTSSWWRRRIMIHNSTHEDTQHRWEYYVHWWWWWVSVYLDSILHSCIYVYAAFADGVWTHTNVLLHIVHITECYSTMMLNTYTHTHTRHVQSFRGCGSCAHTDGVTMLVLVCKVCVWVPAAQC